MAWLQFTFSLAVLCFFVVAQNITLGRICNPNANHLDPATHHWVSDCDSKTFCDGGICHPKRCRTHELDTGYSPDEFLPPLCPQGEFCPDAESECQPVRGVGGLCELSRDGMRLWWPFYYPSRILFHGLRHRSMRSSSKRATTSQQPQQ